MAERSSNAVRESFREEVERANRAVEKKCEGLPLLNLDATLTFVCACYAGIERHTQVFKTATVELAKEVE